MSKRTALMAVLLAMVVSFAGMPAGADDVTVIDTSGTTPFLYGGNSYIPLTSAASFLGAQMQWDAAKGRTVFTHQGKELVLTPGSRNAWSEGRPVVLTAAPVVANGRTYIPTWALKRLYDVPVVWDQARSRVRIKGPTGWGVVTVSRRPPPGWYHGRKTGWRKHGDATMPPGLSKKQGPHSVIVVPKTKVKSHQIEKRRNIGPRGTPTPSPKEKTRGRRGR